MKKIIYTEKAPAPIGPYSQAILADNTLYISGQIAINPETGKLVVENIEAQTELALNHIKHILKAADMDLRHVVKCSIFLSDMTFFPRVNRVYEQFFDQVKPARETVAVAGLPKAVDVEISAIAVR